jgi:hypothetical protein
VPLSYRRPRMRRQRCRRARVPSRRVATAPTHRIPAAKPQQPDLSGRQVYYACTPKGFFRAVRDYSDRGIQVSSPRGATNATLL